MNCKAICGVIFMAILFHSCTDQSVLKNRSLVRVIHINKLIESNRNVQLIDVRQEDEYAHSHIPGAINLYRTELSDEYHALEGMRLSKKDLAELLGSMGLTHKDSIYLYDAKGNVDASRLWWMLKLYGFEKTALIDGGFIQWRMNGFSEEEGLQYKGKETFRFPKKEHPELLAEIEDVESVKFDQLIDARSMEEFDGSLIKNGAFRAGHIPSAIRFDYVEMLNSGDLTFKTKEEVLALMDKKGLSEDKKTITYCHSGVRSAMALFVLREIVGMKEVSNFDGSWIEWSSMEALPAEK